MTNISQKTKIIIGVISILIIISITSLFIYNSLPVKTKSISNNTSTTKSSTDKITKGGTYTITGSTNAITINTTEEVELILENTTITSTNGPAINIENAKKTKIILKGKNTINSTTTESLPGAIYSKDDLELSGDGSLELTSNYDGIASTDNLVINGGIYTIKTGDDGIRSKETLEINAGEFTITAVEGIESTHLKINGGTINIEASDDGLNASTKSDKYTPLIEITGGKITIKMGQGDTDAIDSNGDLSITGGEIDITATSPFDYDGTATYTGGTITVNGEKVTELTNQFMGEQKGPQENGAEGPRGPMR